MVVVLVDVGVSVCVKDVWRVSVKISTRVSVSVWAKSSFCRVMVNHRQG